MELKNIKEIILYSDNIIHNLKIELNKIANTFGYNDFKDIQCRMDNKFINVIKNHLSNDLTGYLNNYVEIKEIHADNRWAIIHESISLGNNKHLFKENIAYLNSYQQDFKTLEI